jgi:hypothetical protein
MQIKDEVRALVAFKNDTFRANVMKHRIWADVVKTIVVAVIFLLISRFG